MDMPCCNRSSRERRVWRTKLYERQGGRCAYCDCGVTIDPALALTPTYGTLDHVVPRVKGGAKTSLTNMVLACASCNNRKGRMSADDFRRLVHNERGNVHVV